MALEEKTAVVLSLVPKPHLLELRRRAYVNRIIEILQDDRMEEVTDFVIVVRTRSKVEKTQICTRHGASMLVGMLERAKFDVLSDLAAEEAIVSVDSGDDEGA